MNQYPLIAREGWPFIAISLLAVVLSFSYNLNNLSIFFSILLLFKLQFFRDPARKINSKDNAVFSAADGRVISIEETDDPYNKRRALKISVFMNVFNVHSNKAPISGKIINKVYMPGKFINADFDKASTENEQCAITIQNSKKQLFTSVQIAGLIARRILCYVGEGKKIKAGDRYGFIRFGSRVDHYIPLESKVSVKLGQKVKNTTTILAILP
jgi:phosphatidylserine decarboxylase